MLEAKNNRVVWANLSRFNNLQIRQGEVNQYFRNELANPNAGVTGQQLESLPMVIETISEGHGAREYASMFDSLQQESWFDPERTVWLSASADIPTGPIPVIRYPLQFVDHCHWLTNWLIHARRNPPPGKERSILCLVRRPSVKRSKMIAALLSNFDADDRWIGYGSMLQHPRHDPISGLDLPFIFDAPTPWPDPDLRQHRCKDTRIQQCLFNVIVETSNIEQDEECWCSLFVTEKTFKCFAWQQIPIWWSTPGLVNEIRRYGFDLFDDWMDDHSYDQIQDNQKRLDKIISVLRSAVARAKQQGVAQTGESIKERLASNYRRLLQLKQLDLDIWWDMNRKLQEWDQEYITKLLKERFI